MEQFVNFYPFKDTLRKKMQVRIAYMKFFLYLCSRFEDESVG